MFQNLLIKRQTFTCEFLSQRRIKVTRDLALVSIGRQLAIWLKLHDLLSKMPTIIQIQFVTCFRFFTDTKALNFSSNRLYNS